MRASLVKLGLSMAAISGPAGTTVACFCRLKRGRMRKKECDAMRCDADSRQQTADSRQQAGCDERAESNVLSCAGQTDTTCAARDAGQIM
jgi:hypothetical protein